MFKRFVDDIIAAQTRGELFDILYSNTGVQVQWKNGMLVRSEYDSLVSLAHKINELMRRPDEKEVKF